MSVKKAVYYISLAALFLIPIFPLIVANSFYFPFITGKGFYFRILVELAFSGWIILAFLDTRYRPKFNALTVSVTIFTVVALGADLLGVNLLRSIWSNFERMEGWITIIHLWMFYMAASSIFGTGEGGKKMWHRWFNASLLMAFIVGCYGFAQLFGWAAIHQGSTRIDASLGNAAYMAVYMLWSAGLSAYLFFVARKRTDASSTFLQWLYGILFLIFSFLLFETATRGTILGLFGGVMLALFLYALLAKNDKPARRWWAIVIIVILIALGGALYAARNTSFVKNHDTLSRLANISWSESQGQARNYIWPMAIKGFTERPILGWGQENFNYIFNANFNPKMWNQEQWFDRAHSVFLDWLTASGFVGLLAYLSLYVLFLVIVWKSDLTIPEKSVLTGLLAGYAIHNVFVFDNLASYVMFFSALGFATSLREGKSIRWFGTQPMRADAVEYIVTPIVIVLLAASIYFLNIRPIQANTRLIAALRSCATATPDPATFENALAVGAYTANQEIREQILACTGQVVGSQQVPGPTKQAFYELTKKAIQDQISATPKDARIYAIGGSLLTSIGDYSGGTLLLEAGHELSPGKQGIDFSLANDYLHVGKIPEALVLLKQAYESDPTYTQAKIAYANVLVFSGQENQARELFNNDPTLFETAQMAQIFMGMKQYQKALAIYSKLASADPSNLDAQVQLAQAQYAAGMKSIAIASMREIEKNHPELKAQVEALITEMQK